MIPSGGRPGLVLEVKGDFCYDIREILEKAGRKDDYIELGLDGRWQWNPLSAHWLDTYSLAYTVSTLLNQLFGKGKDPFWQQAYTNLVKWIIELYRIFPDRWVTLQDVYRCAINPDLFQEKIEAASGAVDRQKKGILIISSESLKTHLAALGGAVMWTAGAPGEITTADNPRIEAYLKSRGVEYRKGHPKRHTDTDKLELRLESVKRWYAQDWMKLDEKLRTSCVEGISSFLSLFDMEDVAAVFCPGAPLETHGVGDDPTEDRPRPRRLGARITAAPSTAR